MLAVRLRETAGTKELLLKLTGKLVVVPPVVWSDTEP